MPQPLLELEAIDSVWLTEALRGAGVLPNARVVSHDLEHVGLFSTDVWRIVLRYDDPQAAAAEGAPSTLIAKRPKAGRPLRHGESFAAESRFYREVAPRTPARFATCIAGSVEDDPVQLLLMEEVATRPFRWNAVDGHGELAVDALAAMHARWWGLTDELDWIPFVGAREGSTLLDERLAEGWAAGEGVVRELTSATFCELIEAMVGRVQRTLAPLRESPTLLHGDAHGENLPLLEDGSAVVLLDWPGPRLGLAACDLAAFVIMSYPSEHRREVERSLVERHARALEAAGAPARADPWLDYRRGALRRVTNLVDFTPNWPQDATARRGLRMVVERISTAAVDLHLHELVL